MKWWSNANAATRVRYAYGFGVALAIVVYAVHAWHAGPKHEGRRIRTWVNMSASDAFAADMVVEIGEPAIPYLVSAIEGEQVDNGTFRLWLRRVLPFAISGRTEPQFGLEPQKVWSELLKEIRDRQRPKSESESSGQSSSFDPRLPVIDPNDMQATGAMGCGFGIRLV